MSQYVLLVYEAEVDPAEQAERERELPMARWGTVEVRPVVSADEWLRVARQAGADVPDEAVEDLA